MGDLKKHIEVKHEGIRYNCDLCEYSATRPGQVRKHKESQHKLTYNSFHFPPLEITQLIYPTTEASITNENM